MPPALDRFDYIVVGAGSAGCVLANRLTEDGTARVLLLEAGGSDWHPLIHMPLAMRVISTEARFNWGYHTEPEPHCYNRRIFVPRGRVLGGSSSINAMIYARGHPLDYDQWRQSGLAGWGYDDVLPYFKRSEANWRGETQHHGGTGPLQVSPAAKESPFYDLVAAAAGKVGFKPSADYNGAEPEGMGRPELTIGQGRRWSTARAFLRPARARANLTIRTKALAHRVLFENGRAVGVEWSEGGALKRAHVEREVILSGGSYNSPQLLLLSGIGPAEDLSALGIPVIADRAEVGRNLEEHVNTSIVFDINQPLSMEPQMRLDRLTWSVLRWAFFGTGPAARFASQCASFIRVRPESERPDIELLISPVAPDTHIWFPWIAPSIGHRFSSRIAVLHPRSRGRLTLHSPNPADHIRILWNLFDDPEDLKTLRLGLKAVRSIFAAEPLKSLVTQEVRPGANIASDDAIDDYLRHNCATAQHPACTCRMGADEGSVVDEELRVRGVEGLRVVDCSVMPHVVGGNTNAPTIMIAEKASDMIRGKAPLPRAVLS